MRLSPAEQLVLADALSALADGQSRRFEDLLWLGFGDRWTLIEASLLQHHQIRLADAMRNVFAITDLGLKMLDELAPVPQRAVG